jgi:acid phosphatase
MSLMIRCKQACVNAARPLAAFAFASLFAGCGSGGGGGSPPGTSNITGVVIGSYFRNAKVCLDANGNGACDAGEVSSITDNSGQFILLGAGSPIVAEISTAAVEYDPDTNSTAPVSSKIVLRAPREAPGVVSLHSTSVVSEMESSALTFVDALQKVAAWVGVSTSKILTDFNKEADPTVKGILKTASSDGIKRIQFALANAKPADDTRRLLASASGTLDKISTVVVIYMENRSFNNLYGLFPGANGIAAALANPSTFRQLDRDGITVLPKLPAVWSASSDPAGTWSFVANLPNAPFRIDAQPALGLATISPDPSHRFYENQMQINGGGSKSFAAWSTSGGLAVGYYDGSPMKMWKLAQQYTLADNFFQGAYGGSFLNHFWMVCACSPVWANPPASGISSVDSSGTRLNVAASSPASALVGPRVYVADGNITPLLADGKYYAINTTQPPYQPSAVRPPPGGDSRLADPTGGSSGNVPLPVQTMKTIADTLASKNVGWKWYAGAWNQALADPVSVFNDTSQFEPHHHTFNYFSRFDPTKASGAAERAAHFKDYADLLTDIQNGSLPPVAFYKPQRDLTQHPGEANITSGDAHMADLVARLQASPQWKNMLVVVTYDENGGFWDHVTPPKADQWGPGTRVPTIVISPYAKKSYVDSVPYDTTSIIKFLTRRFGLESLPGARSVVSDLSNSLDMAQ